MQSVFSLKFVFMAVVAFASAFSTHAQAEGYAQMPDPVALSSGVVSITPNRHAFAALKADGSVVTWGSKTFGGDSSSVSAELKSGVKSIVASDNSFAALKVDGTVVVWGYPPLVAVFNKYASAIKSNNRSLIASEGMMAVVKSDGSVVLWDSSSWSSEIVPAFAAKLKSGIVSVVLSGRAAAVLKADGSAITVGNPANTVDMNDVTLRLQSDVTSIIENGEGVFAANKKDGSVVVWGMTFFGKNPYGVSQALSGGVRTIVESSNNYAAIKFDGSVVLWSDRMQPEPVGSEIAAALSSNVLSVASDNAGSFAAVKLDGSVVTWGNSKQAGDSTSVAADLKSGVTSVIGSEGLFAALKTNGSVVVWGNGWCSPRGYTNPPREELASGIKAISAHSWASSFAAVKADGSAVAWGCRAVDSNITDLLKSGVKTVITNQGAFAALKSDGSVVTWGSYWGS